MAHDVFLPNVHAINDQLRLKLGRRYKDRKAWLRLLGENGDIGLTTLRNMPNGEKHFMRSSFEALAAALGLADASELYHEPAAPPDETLPNRIRHLLRTAFVADEALYMTEAELGVALSEMDTAVAACRSGDRALPLMSPRRPDSSPRIWPASPPASPAARGCTTAPIERN